MSPHISIIVDGDEKKKSRGVVCAMMPLLHFLENGETYIEKGEKLVERVIEIWNKYYAKVDNAKTRQRIEKHDVVDYCKSGVTNKSCELHYLASSYVWMMKMKDQTEAELPQEEVQVKSHTLARFHFAY